MLEKVLPRFELGLPDSESGVITVTPQDRCSAIAKHIWGSVSWLRPGKRRTNASYVHDGALHIVRHQWSSGRIHRCHRCDPGSIPG